MRTGFKFMGRGRMYILVEASDADQAVNVANEVYGALLVSLLDVEPATSSDFEQDAQRQENARCHHEQAKAKLDVLAGDGLRLAAILMRAGLDASNSDNPFLDEADRRPAPLYVDQAIELTGNPALRAEVMAILQRAQAKSMN